ncbi:MAG: O-antigen ligase family protein [Bacilli bacterium]|nr:O-antigen ligase family protein [Bacilli bacterium]
MKNKLINLIKENSNLLGILCLFIVIEPFLDILPLFENEKYFIFGFTIPTLVRCGFIGILGLITLRKIEKKHYKFLIIYFIMLIIYTIIHHSIASDSSMIIPNNFTYSLVSELFYIIRMLLPLAIIEFTRNTNITEEKFLKVITISAAIIGTIIFIGNTLCISYVSYGEGHTVINWLKWFTTDLNQYEFTELTSKGWFYMANQVSGLTILLLPFCIFATLKKYNFINMYTTIILIISMIMLGTRIASFGWILIVICILLAITLSKYIYKDKRTKTSYYKTILIFSVIGLIFLTCSPISRRQYGYELGDLSSLKERPQIDNNEESLQKAYTYIEESYEVFKIQEEYLYELYHYKFDPGFWYNIFDRSIENGVIENREMQRLISNRIIENNQNKLKYGLFGYSFSRMRNGGIYMEHDIIVQLFTMGYLGTILLIGPYIFIIAIICIKVIKKMKKKIALFNITFLLSIGAVLGTSILTGHILDELFVTIYIGFICGYFLRKLDRKKEENES